MLAEALGLCKTPTRGLQDQTDGDIFKVITRPYARLGRPAMRMPILRCFPMLGKTRKLLADEYENLNRRKLSLGHESPLLQPGPRTQAMHTETLRANRGQMIRWLMYP
jgi:hypothetical protein